MRVLISLHQSWGLKFEFLWLRWSTPTCGAKLFTCCTVVRRGVPSPVQSFFLLLLLFLTEKLSCVCEFGVHKNIGWLIMVSLFLLLFLLSFSICYNAHPVNFRYFIFNLRICICCSFLVVSRLLIWFSIYLLKVCFPLFPLVVTLEDLKSFSANFNIWPISGLVSTDCW